MLSFAPNHRHASHRCSDLVVQSDNPKLIHCSPLGSLRGFAASAIIWGLNPAKLGLTCPKGTQQK
jgi:hypothetical protein